MKKQIFITVLLYVCVFLNSSAALYCQEFKKDIYAQRRQKLMESINDGIIIFKNADPAPRSGGEFYAPYRTNSNFYYLTGYEEAESAFILLPGEKKKFIMFVQPKNALSDQWFGEVPGIEGAMKIFGADTAFAYQDFNTIVGSYLKGKKKVYLDLYDEAFVKIISDEIDKIKDDVPKEKLDAARAIFQMRVIKDAGEIKLIQKAVDITCSAHLEAMKAIEPGIWEYEISAIYSYIFEKEGAWDKAFPVIAASGPNSTIYHYSSNSRKTAPGDLVMLDVGAEYKKYAADITRVFPVNGKFSKEQKEIYNTVLEMEKAVINYMKPGNTFGDCLKKAEVIAKDALFKLGLIMDKNSKWQHILYYYPYICHYVGLDVHDVGGLRDTTVLKPGMVFALEPLIYVGENLIGSFKLQAIRKYKIPEKEVDDFIKTIRPVFNKYKEIATRVEDDILITKEGNKVLSAGLPKTIEEIEKTMAEKSYLNKK